MKDYSVAQIKRGLKLPLNQSPRDGSKLRELFDLFHSYKGQIIDFGVPNSKFARDLSSRLVSLRDFYGMEIRHCGKNKWSFDGEYIGAAYVEYKNDKPLKIKVKVKGE